MSAEPIAVCPACGTAAFYMRRADRYFHADGTESRTCWAAVARGEASRPRPFTVAALVDQLVTFDPGMDVVAPFGPAGSAHAKVGLLPRRFKRPRPDAVLIYGSDDDYELLLEAGIGS